MQALWTLWDVSLSFLRDICTWAANLISCTIDTRAKYLCSSNYGCTNNKVLITLGGLFYGLFAA